MSKISHYFQPKRKASDEAASSCKAGGKRPCLPVQLLQPRGRAAATVRGSRSVGPEALASNRAGLSSPPPAALQEIQEIDVGAVAAHYGLAALSPLERQVVALKAEVPGCVLLAEVGYKFCAFGEDAEVLAAVLHVCSFTKQHMLVAGFPTQRSRPIVLAAALVAAPEARPLAQAALWAQEEESPRRVDAEERLRRRSPIPQPLTVQASPRGPPAAAAVRRAPGRGGGPGGAHRREGSGREPSLDLCAARHLRPLLCDVRAAA